MQSMRNLATLRPHESTYWYLQGIQGKDWWTSNTAMDSLINLKNIDPVLLIELFNQPDVSEKIMWRITHVMGNLDVPESISFLEEAKKNNSWLVRMEALASTNLRLY